MAELRAELEAEYRVLCAESAARARQMAPELAAIVLGVPADTDEFLATLNGGHVFRMLRRPPAPGELAGALRAAAELRSARRDRDTQAERLQRRLDATSL